MLCLYQSVRSSFRISIRMHFVSSRSFVPRSECKDFDSGRLQATEVCQGILHQGDTYIMDAIHPSSKPAMGIAQESSDIASTSTVPSTTTKSLGKIRCTSRFARICLNTTPAFFSLNMGTGITSILLHDLPYNAHWVQILGNVVFVLNIILFLAIAFASLVRYIKWRGVFTVVLVDKQAAMFWGCLPMGLSTIVVSVGGFPGCALMRSQNMVALVCVPAWGYRWAQVALGLWWIDVVLSITVNFGVVFLMCVIPGSFMARLINIDLHDNITHQTRFLRLGCFRLLPQ
jgi:hypothetical protein